MREITKREPQRRQWLERGTFALALYILSYLRGLRVFWIEKFRLEFSNTGIGFLNKTSKTKFVQNCYPKSDFGWQIQTRVFGYANFVGFFFFRSENPRDKGFAKLFSRAAVSFLQLSLHILEQYHNSRPCFGLENPDFGIPNTVSELQPKLSIYQCEHNWRKRHRAHRNSFVNPSPGFLKKAKQTANNWNSSH